MRFSLAFALLCCLTGAAHATPASHAATPHKAYLSLIIDDLGQNLPRDRRVLALPGPVTTAVMPDTPHAAEFAREAHKAGKIVILHMPMDPATGPFAWHPDLPVDELAKRLNAAFKAVPYTSGINNHMGSRMTSQPQAMAWLMGNLQQRHKFFVDSRTSAQTVAAAETHPAKHWPGRFFVLRLRRPSARWCGCRQRTYGAAASCPSTRPWPAAERSCGCPYGC